MNQTQEEFVNAILGKGAKRFEVRSEDGFLPGWYLEFHHNTCASENEFVTYASNVVNSMRLQAQDIDVRLFVGSKYPLVTDLRCEDSMVLYAIPSLQIGELAEVFEVNQGALTDYTYEAGLVLSIHGYVDQRLWTPEERRTFARDLTRRMKSPTWSDIEGERSTDRRSYYELVIGQCPWRRVRKALERIHDRYPFEISSISPEHLKATFLKYPLNSKEAKWCADIILRASPQAADVTAPAQIWENIVRTATFQLRWSRHKLWGGGET